MMLNVQELTARLSMMADPALQQYAALHKDDPYVLALAVSEANRRRQVRTAQQGVAGMQPQPTVADQEVAQMNAPAMPEQIGIGALAAPALASMPAGGIAGEEEMEPQAMAGGGMVAFAGGGDVERYQFGGMPPASGVTEFAIPGMVQPSRSFMPQPGAPENTPFLRRKLREMQERGRSYQIAQAQARISMGVGSAADRALVNALMEGKDEAPKTDVRARVTPPAGATPAAAATSLLSPALVQPVGAPPGAAPDASADTSARPPGESKQPAAPGAGVTAGTKPTSDAAPGGLGDLNALYNRILSGQTYTDPAAAQLKALEAKELAAVEAEKADIQRDQARFADAFKGREARLGKRESELTKQRDTNTGLAFLNAGLAIMSTPGGLATAIGKGARVGTEQFAAGLDKIRSAQEKLDEARDRMEELKLNRDEMSAKEIRAANARIRQVGIEAEKRGIDGLRQAAGVNRETAKNLFDKTVQAQLSLQESASRERAARTAATAQQNFLTALGAAAPDSPLRRGYEISKQEGSVPKLYEAYQKLAADVTPTIGGKYTTKGEEFRARFPAFEDYMAQYPGALGGGTGFTKPPEGATVLK